MKFPLFSAVTCLVLFGILVEFSRAASQEEYRKLADNILEQSRALLKNIDEYLKSFSQKSSNKPSFYISDQVTNNEKVKNITVFKIYF